MSSAATPYCDQPAPSDKLGLDDYATLKDIDAALHLIDQAVDGEEYERKLRGAIPHPYLIRDGAIWKRVIKDGITLEVRLTTFAVRITAEIIESDGEESARYYEIEATAGGRTVNFTIPASEYRSLDWTSQHLGGAAVIVPPAKDLEVAAAIQLLSPEDRPIRHRHTHTGWITHNGADLYIDGAGAIGAGGRVNGIEVALPPQFQLYALEEPASPEDLVEAIQASLAITKVVPIEYSTPILATPYQAPVERAPDSLFFDGGTGSFKSCCTALATQHFGRGLDYLNLTESFMSTVNALREVTYKGKDTLVPVDDFSRPPDHYRAAELDEKAGLVFRGVANRAGRSRARRDGSLQAGHRPRATVIASGTQLPPADDVQARLTLLHLQRDLIDLKALTRSQRDGAEGKFAKAMFGFVRWVARDRQARLDYYHRRVNELTEKFRNESAHPRTAPAMAAKMAVLEFLVKYASEAGALDDVEADAWNTKFMAALLKTAEAQVPDRSLIEPPERFLRLVENALEAGRCHLVSASGDMLPDDLTLKCGWRRNINGSWETAGPLIGWVDEERDWERLHLYLNPSESFAVVQRLASDMKQPFVIGERDLHRRLKDAGYLVIDGHASNEIKSRNTLTIRKMLGGVRRSVLHVDAEQVLGLDGDDDPSPPSSAKRQPLADFFDDAI
jgi:hypothetical protein